jgi:hypothetical protein
VLRTGIESDSAADAERVSNKHETKNGLATDYDSFEDPDAGVVELPELDDPFTSVGGEEIEVDDHHRSPITRYYTWSVAVDDLTKTPRRESARAPLPTPETIAASPHRTK